MTLVLGICANDGVVLVADGQATAESDDGPSTRSSARKLGDLHGLIAYGCAGNSGLRQRVVQSLDETITAADCRLPIADLRPKLHRAINTVQHAAASEWVHSKGWMDLLVTQKCPLVIQVLFAGVDQANGQPWIYEVASEGAEEVHLKGEAIGGGAAYARYALMSAGHYNLRDGRLVQVQALAYRAVDDAIRTDASVLGLPISVYVVTPDGAREIVDDELGALRTSVRAWQGNEREIFHKSDVFDKPVPESAPSPGPEGIEPPAEGIEPPG